MPTFAFSTARPTDQAVDVLVLPVYEGPFVSIVTEIARPGFRMEGISTLPAGPFGWAINAGFDANGDPLPDTTNGGYAQVPLNVGGPSTQTLVRFANRSLPGRIKVCKVP